MKVSGGFLKLMYTLGFPASSRSQRSASRFWSQVMKKMELKEETELINGAGSRANMDPVQTASRVKSRAVCILMCRPWNPEFFRSGEGVEVVI